MSIRISFYMFNKDKKSLGVWSPATVPYGFETTNLTKIRDWLIQEVEKLKELSEISTYNERTRHLVERDLSLLSHTAFMKPTYIDDFWFSWPDAEILPYEKGMT